MLLEIATKRFWLIGVVLLRLFGFSGLLVKVKLCSLVHFERILVEGSPIYTWLANTVFLFIFFFTENTDTTAKMVLVFFLKTAKLVFF